MAKIDVISVLVDEKYSKSVTVPEAADHHEKFTLYKIILYATPEKTLENEQLRFVLWRRYRDIHKIHAKMEMVHKQLYLKGQYPVLAKPDFFGRHEPIVVEERRQTTENFLDFVVKNSVLCKTDVLHAFFQGAEIMRKRSDDDDAPESPVLQPTVVNFSMSVSSEDGEDLHQECSSSADLQHQDHAAAHPPKSLESFDPFASSEQQQSGNVSNFQLLSEVLAEGASTATTSEENVSAIAMSQRVDEGGIPEAIPKHGSMLDVTKEKSSPGKPIRNIRSTGNLPVTRSVSPSAASNTWLKKFTNTISPMKRAQQNNVAADYLVQAGEFISAAQKSEAESVYDFAFTLYKSAIMLLISGVQEEKDLNRRNAVRVQLNKYLRRAEKLYRKHLSSDSSEEFVISSFPARLALDVNLIGLQGHYTDLKQYKSIGVLGPRVQLVQELQSDELFALKIVDKSCYDAHLNQLLSLCIPINVPHMVKLIRFWELHHCVILLLEYATNGKLWDHLKSYFKMKRQNFLKCSYSQFRSPRYGTNRKILFRIGDNENNAESVPTTTSGSARNSLDLTANDDNVLGQGAVDDLEQSDKKMFNQDLYETFICRWTAQIIVALCHLHAEGMICRDLQPNNILLDDNNNIILSYFCTLDFGHKRVDENSLHNFYCAPELLHLNESSVSKGCDWWSLGVILYELATGLPLHFVYPQGFTNHSVITLPGDVSLELKDLINKLLRFDTDERLGCGIDGEEILKSHPFFDGINWSKFEF